VAEGFEAGLEVETATKIKVGDILECYKARAVARHL